MKFVSKVVLTAVNYNRLKRIIIKGKLKSDKDVRSCKS